MMVYLTGIAAVAASIAFVTGKEARTAGLLTAALMFTYVFVLHIPTIVSASDRMMQLVSIANAVKDLGLAGGALMVAQTHRIKVSTESSAPTA